MIIRLVLSMAVNIDEQTQESLCVIMLIFF